MRSKWQEEDG